MRADFYILNNNNKLEFACRLLDKAQQQEQSIYVQSHSEQMAREFDEYLWTYQDASFIPHARYAPNCDETIQIGHQDTLDQSFDVLLNLSDSIPAFYQQFQRIIEIIPADIEGKKLGREHYRSYQEKGLELQAHHIN